MNEGHTKGRLKELQSLPLERKVGFTAARIAEWYSRYEGQVYVSFSGGKDSTVLLHLVRSLFPEVKAVFIDTGLEYPEIKEFVKTFDNVEVLRPKMSFKQVLEKYGYPVVSKEISCGIFEISHTKSLKLRNKRLYGDDKGNGKISECWKFLIDAPFKISPFCCNVMKKNPAKHFEKKSGLRPLVATMTEESRLRETAWTMQGCNAFNAARPISSPLSFWTEQDVLTYIKLKSIKIASVYGSIEQDVKGTYYTTGCNRTGCVFCLFGIHRDTTPNRIQRLATTHPKLYKYCLDVLGLRQVMDFLKVPCMPR
jgi:3'-phosphoadenosine 5'-phosphosulfate sulfotransferase (PAPS reductase)/FAD synthetase